MEDYKEFTGKSLDEAMAAACQYFGLERGKLEIDILSDAKSGIFGLVGAKKASIRARKANLEHLNLKVGSERENGEKKAPAKNVKAKREKAPAPAPKDKAQSEDAGEGKENSRPAERKAERPAARKAERPNERQTERSNQHQSERPAEAKVNGPAERQSETAEKPAEKPNREKANHQPSDENKTEKGKKPGTKGREKNRQERNNKARPERPKQNNKELAPADSDTAEDRFPEVPLESLDQAVLEAEVLTVVDSMTRHIVGDTGKEFEATDGKVRVRIDSGEDSGLLIGRDGQTLSALQYLASCIVSRRLNASIRVQIDAGDYRSRQLEKLRTTALELAAKVKENGKPQSTRPMSAYLRRAVHMALQDDPDIQTHSKGDGSLKRVVIVPRKK